MRAPLALASAFGFCILAGIALAAAPYMWGVPIAFVCIGFALGLHYSRDYQIEEELTALTVENLYGEGE